MIILKSYSNLFIGFELNVWEIAAIFNTIFRIFKWSDLADYGFVKINKILDINYIENATEAIGLRSSHILTGLVGVKFGVQLCVTGHSSRSVFVICYLYFNTAA